MCGWRLDSFEELALCLHHVSQGLNSALQAWKQALLTPKPSPQPHAHLCNGFNTTELMQNNFAPVETTPLMCPMPPLTLFPTPIYQPFWLLAQAQCQATSKHPDYLP